MSATEEPSLWRGALPRILISLAIGGGFLWLLVRGGLPLLPPREALARLPGWSLVAYGACMLAANFLRTYRWNYLIRPIAPESRPMRVTAIALVGFAAIFLLPLRSGEVVRPYLLTRDGQVSFMQAAGTVGAERIIDGLTLTLLTFVALMLATPISPAPTSLGDLPLPVSAIPAAVLSALIMFAGAFAVMAAFYVARRQARSLVERVVGIVSIRAGAWAANVLERTADGLRFLPSRASLLPFLASTLGVWSFTMLAQWVILRGLGLPASVSQAMTTIGVQALGSLVPAGPGMFGAFQIAGFSALAMYFPMEQVKLEGGVFIFVTYTGQVLINCLMLIIGAWMMARVPARST